MAHGASGRPLFMTSDPPPAAANTGSAQPLQPPSPGVKPAHLWEGGTVVYVEVFCPCALSQKQARGGVGKGCDVEGG